MQILVVVANIQARTLKAEVEKGFSRTAFDRELVVPKIKINLVNWTIGYSLVSFGVLGGVFYYFVSRYIERESGLIFLNLDSDKRR